jgi:large-conductance mechanosensitive channel
VNTILVVVVTLLLIAVTVFLSVKLSDRRVKRTQEYRVDQPQAGAKEC